MAKNQINHPHIQGRIFLRARSFYERHLRFEFLTVGLKKFLSLIVCLLGRIKGFSFPTKYPWDWKLEMLTYRFEPETVHLCRQILRPGMVAIDVGAHIGYYTRLFSRLVGAPGQVYAIEPIPDNFSLLVKNVRGRKNVRLFNVAAGDKNGPVDFFQVRGHSACHSLLPPPEAHERLMVESLTLDELASRHNLNAVDLIKIDVEGGEPLVLAGAQDLLRRSPALTIIMEFNKTYFERRHEDATLLFDRLGEIGFDFFVLQGSTLKPFERQHWQSLSYDNEEYANILCRKISSRT